MKKKTKKVITRKPKRKLNDNVFRRFSTLSFLLLITVILSTIFITPKLTKTRVLGTNTSNVEQDHKDEIESENETEDDNETEIETELEENIENEDEAENKIETENNKSSITSEATVDCIGPDGKHFVSSLKDCKEFNYKWGIKSFKYTVLGNTKKDDQLVKEKEEYLKSKKTKNESSKIEIEKKNESNKRELEIKKEKDKITIKEKSSKIESDKHEQELDEVNSNLEKSEIEIGTSHAKKLRIKSGNVEAETELELLVNEQTSKVSIVTKTGTHNVNIIPSLAVQNLLMLDVISSVESQDSTLVASSEATNTITLTEFEDEPAFKVNGVLEKKVLGFIPIAFSKTVYVSADNGKILRTEESIQNKILQYISF